jgi:predicted enzyme related to lactoylglutathione lyase
MADIRDPFDELRRPLVPLVPRPEFVASLFDQLREEFGMTSTEEAQTSESTQVLHGGLAMVHLRVVDADRAMRFFGALFGWQAERVPFGGHVSHYTVNTTMTIRILDDPASPPVVPNYAVADVARVMSAVDGGGGRITEAEPAPDGGGWARGVDDQGLPLLVYRPGAYHPHAAPTQPASAELGLVFIRADAAKAATFYGDVLGWSLVPAHPDSHYFDTVANVGVFDEAAAFGHAVEPSATLYFSVEALLPMLRQIESLGGHAGDHAQDMGPYFTAVCTDDQGTTFGVMSAALDSGT